MAHERFDVRFHGRGGQGVVTAAELLSVAAFDEGHFAQAIPSFGSERMGAPVVAFCRISDRPIRTRAPIAVPDAVVVGDPTLVHQVDLLEGLAPDGWVLLNTSADAAHLGMGGVRVATVAASELARRYLGRPVPNAALLGGLCALTGVVGLAALADALRARFPGAVGEDNVLAAAAGYESVAAGVPNRVPAAAGGG